MAVHNNLAVIMAKNRKFSLDEISKATGLSKNTLSSFKLDKATGIQYRTLEALCQYFHCGIEDLLTIEKDAG
jgi:putative transcriptional regulator